MAGALEGLRRTYAEAVTRAAGVTSPRIVAAFRGVPRERYLGPPPWTVLQPGTFRPAVTSDPADLYADALVVLDAARGINNGQPSLHAAWLARVAPLPGEAVVQIGAGSGYYTAILAELVAPNGRVEAYEVDPALADRAAGNLRPYADVVVHPESAVARRLPRADVVYVAAAAPAPDPAWLDALEPGGRLVMPWEPVPGRGGAGLLVRREAEGFAAVPRARVGFIPCQGLAASADAVVQPDALLATRSVWRRRDRAPDARATAIFDEVWFSSEPVGEGA